MSTFKYNEKQIDQYINLAAVFGSWSKDPSKKVGAVAIGNYGQVLSQGYNGFPRNFKDYPYLYESKTLKNNYIIHAEMNCIYHAAINNVSLENASLFVHGLHVCHECAKGIIQTGIKEVYSFCSGPFSSKWLHSFNITEELFEEANIKYKKIN